MLQPAKFEPSLQRTVAPTLNFECGKCAFAFTFEVASKRVFSCSGVQVNIMIIN
jgi:hypothetical protein